MLFYLKIKKAKMEIRQEANGDIDRSGDKINCYSRENKHCRQNLVIKFS
jgi:hypothetical protein